MPKYTRKVAIPGKTSAELYEKVSAEIDLFMQKTGLGDYKIDRDLGQKELKLSSSMITATLYCREGEFELTGNLSFLAMPFRSKIDSGIDRWLSKAFNLALTQA